jgi:endonuclease/exonuclease/phosphatase family metal-dependent hydrolase
MTRNMYLGTDLRPIVGAQTGAEFVAAAAAGYSQVLVSNPSERAAAVAKEILLTQPDIVSLQEVYQWRTGPVFNSAPATTVTVDQLASLQTALTALHLHYAPVVVQVNSDLEAPIPAPGINADVRATDRDVILARTDLPQSLLKVSNPQTGRYDADLAFTSPVLGPVASKRGWVAVGVTRFGRTARVVNTHLESYNPAIPATGIIQRAQNVELLGSVSAVTTPVILSGDFNSGPSEPDAVEKPPIDAYNDTLAVGFADTWSAAHLLGNGYTWAISEGDSRTTATPSQRIDHVYVRGAVQPITDIRTGAIKTPSGLYASDHMGLVAYTWLNR